MDLILSHCSSLYISTLILLLFAAKGTSESMFNFTNKCDYTVWPGILANAGSSPLDTTGFELPPGGSRNYKVPPNWSGRFWGRTGCTFDPHTGQGGCVTGDCGSNKVECNGAGANPPATLAEFTVGSGAQDYYDVSLVDGYNLPMVVQAGGGSGSCLSTGCVTDLNQHCPTELRVGEGEGCKSACEAFGRPDYCCSGAYGSPATCKPSVYSEMFKTACPKSYSYAYDDATSTFTCMGADYTIIFCPLSTSRKSARDTSPTTGSVTGSNNDTVVVDSPWFPDFFTGHSSETLSFSPSSIASVALLLFLTMH
ncbi:thaumatin-like protein [Quillaja saponaria]|uniref:Thaumatin-like protein n=1 Tax=Quillaja saponaria TaxID=32244 RepID=A0AAD7PJI1_QUISA|nr:thaumatin-like protein [Quillaja saponaria]